MNWIKIDNNEEYLKDDNDHRVVARLIKGNNSGWVCTLHIDEFGLHYNTFFKDESIEKAELKALVWITEKYRDIEKIWNDIKNNLMEARGTYDIRKNY